VRQPRRAQTLEPHGPNLPRNKPSDAVRSGGANIDESWRGEHVIKALFIYAGADLAEIGGCFAFWIWLRSGKSAF
jgi:hypothetical protein